MTASNSITYISHENPVWRPAQSYMAMVDLEPFGFPETNEQLWLRPLEDGRYEVACIPFRVYGLCLGDRVGLEEGGRFVDRVLERSGRRVLRVFFTAPRPSVNGDDVRPDLVAAVEAAQLLSEWSGDRHIAIDVPAGAEMQAVYASVTREIEAGSAMWEWADAEPFQFNRPARPS